MAEEEKKTPKERPEADPEILTTTILEKMSKKEIMEKKKKLLEQKKKMQEQNKE